MKRLIMIVMLVAAVVFGAKAGDNDWAAGITVTKSVKGSGQRVLEPGYWSLGGEISRSFNPVWRLTVTPELKLQYLQYNRGGLIKDSGLSVTLGVDLGIKLCYGFSILTGPAVRYGTNMAKASEDGKAFAAYWDFGVRKDFSDFYITAKYYQSFIKAYPEWYDPNSGGGVIWNRCLHQNNLSLSVGFRF